MTQLPAGWYPDLNTPGEERLWDGIGWTDLRRPVEKQSRHGVLLGFAGLIIALVSVSFGAMSLSGSESSVEVAAARLFSRSTKPQLAFVDETIDPAEESTTTTEPRMGSTGKGGRGNGSFVETTTTTVPLTEIDLQQVQELRQFAHGYMVDVDTISDRTLYNLGNGLCDVAGDVDSTDGFATMTALLWVGLEIDSRATYFNDSDNFLASSTAAVSVFCPELAPAPAS